nr:protein TRACHEARY ELEMENT DIFFERENTIATION-RELATED 7A-like [Aegilops tauschii subsp. strangulata]
MLSNVHDYSKGARSEPPPLKELAPSPSHPCPTSLTTSPRSGRPLPAIAPASCQRSLVPRRRRLPRPRAAVASPTPLAMPSRRRPSPPRVPTAGGCHHRLHPVRHHLLPTPPGPTPLAAAPPSPVDPAGHAIPPPREPAPSTHRLGPVRHRLLPTPPDPTLLAGECTWRERERGERNLTRGPHPGQNRR